MKNLVMVVVAAAFLCLAGCSAKTDLVRPDGGAMLPANAQFEVAPAVDASGYVFEDKGDAFSLSEAMTTSLTQSLGDSAQKGAPYVITTRIKEYAPGNAFARWVMPGAGTTKLSTETVITTADNIEVARIPVERSVGFGGAYTVGAWKHVFDDVAQLTVGVIKNKLVAPAGAPLASAQMAPAKN